MALALSLAAGCSCDGDGDGSVDGSVPLPPLDGATPPDAARSDASVVVPMPGDGECVWDAGARPTADLPPVHENEYTIELGRWLIDNDGGDPVETRQRMNEAIAWAVDEGYDKIIVPPGRYLVGELTNAVYSAGIELPGNMTLELSDETVIEMMPNDRHNYCVITTASHDDITIRGGRIRGDRADHDYEGSAHDEGHGVCVWTSSNRILIENTELTELTGDGVLIVGSAPDDEDPDAEVPSTHITIRNNEIHHNRRQGVSIVGGHNVVIANNHIHHISGTSPQFGIDIEGAGRTDRDILVFQNNFHDNWGGDFVTSSGRNVWLEENTMTQCQVNDEGVYDPSLPCDVDPEGNGQTDGPIVLWQSTDTVVLNNQVRMTTRSSNGLWGMINYPRVREGAYRDNTVGNYIAGNTFYDCGIHGAWNRLQLIANNTVHNGHILLFQLACTRLEGNLINGGGHRYRIRDVAGLAEGNRQNGNDEEGFPVESIEDRHFPMADDSPYRNSSPVFW